VSGINHLEGGIDMTPSRMSFMRISYFKNILEKFFLALKSSSVIF
jgi:hypothetical protein